MIVLVDEGLEAEVIGEDGKEIGRDTKRGMEGTLRQPDSAGGNEDTDEARKWEGATRS